MKLSLYNLVSSYESDRNHGKGFAILVFRHSKGVGVMETHLPYALRPTKWCMWFRWYPKRKNFVCAFGFCAFRHVGLDTSRCI